MADQKKTSCSMDGDRIDNLAFGCILANRVSGDRDLYGSDVRTGGYVTIEIKQAAHYDETYIDRYHGGGQPLIKIALSEAQWVGFVSRMNIGCGVQCTLDYRPAPDVEMIRPKLPSVEKAAERMGRRVTQIREHCEDRVREYQAKLLAAAEARLSKKEMEKFRIHMSCLAEALFDGMEFGATILTEHKEKMVQDALVEVDAAIKGYVSSVGLETIRNAMGPSVPMIESNPGDDP
jgi:hypothetical protein